MSRKSLGDRIGMPWKGWRASKPSSPVMMHVACPTDDQLEDMVVLGVAARLDRGGQIDFRPLLHEPQHELSALQLVA